MGFFSRKKKVSADEMAMQMMVTAVDAIGKNKGYDDVDDAKTMAVGIGYFYGFMKLHLNSVTKLDTVNEIIEESILNLENATRGKPAFEGIGQAVRSTTNRALTSMKEEMKKRPENPFMGVAVDYLKDLYNNPPSIDIGQMMVAAKDMQTLYGVASSLTKDIKIIE